MLTTIFIWPNEPIYCDSFPIFGELKWIDLFGMKTHTIIAGVRSQRKRSNAIFESSPYRKFPQFVVYIHFIWLVYIDCWLVGEIRFHPHESGYILIRNFFFADSNIFMLTRSVFKSKLAVHTYPDGSIVSVVFSSMRRQAAILNICTVRTGSNFVTLSD